MNLKINNYDFILRYPYNPEIYDILFNDKIIAYTNTRWGQLNVFKYNSNDIIFSINFNDEYIGSIPDDMKEDIFESITNKLEEINLKNN
jgi:hypothetical protein